MNSAASASVWFIDSQQLSVSIATYGLVGAPSIEELVHAHTLGQNEQFVEVLLAANYAIRQLSNLGQGAESIGLVRRIKQLKYMEEGDLSCLRDPLGISVTRSMRAHTAKSVQVDLYVADQGAQLAVKASGFGLFNRKLWTDVPDSVVALFVALADLRALDRPFVRRLLLAAIEVERAYLQNQITLTNHSQIAFNIAMGVWVVSVDGEFVEDR